MERCGTERSKILGPPATRDSLVPSAVHFSVPDPRKAFRMSQPEEDSSSFTGQSFSDIDPSLSQSDVITTDEPSIVMDKPKDKEKGIEVPPLPKFTVFAAMQLFGLLALSLGCFLMYLELKSYNLEKDVPDGAVTKAMPVKPVIPPVPKVGLPQGGDPSTLPAAAPAGSAPAAAAPAASASATPPAPTDPSNPAPATPATPAAPTDPSAPPPPTPPTTPPATPPTP
jgi:hypothetical protein